MSVDGEAWGRGETERHLPHGRSNWLERLVMKLVRFIRHRWGKWRDNSA